MGRKLRSSTATDGVSEGCVCRKDGAKRARRGCAVIAQVLNLLLNVEEAHQKMRRGALEPSGQRGSGGGGWIQWQRERFSGTGYFAGRRRLLG